MNELNKLAQLGVIIIWKASDPKIENLYREGSIYQKVFSTGRMEIWNEEVENIIKNEYPKITVWSSGENIIYAQRAKCLNLPQEKITRDECRDNGAHHSESMMDAQFNIFINFLCNRFIHTDNKSCCSLD